MIIIINKNNKFNLLIRIIIEDHFIMNPINGGNLAIDNIFNIRKNLTLFNFKLIILLI